MAAAAAALALLVLLALVRSAFLDRDDLLAPVTRSGSAAGPVDADRFTVEVHDVAFARALDPRPDDPEVRVLRTDQVWVIVTASLTAARERLRVGDPVLLECGDGRSYAASTEFGETLAATGMSAVELSPGIPVTGVLAFEVPADRITDPALRLAAGRLQDETRLSAEALVDLGLEADEVERGVAGAVETMPVPEIRKGQGPGGERADDGG
ncbi:hypothetical protein [Nocardiopsis composta]|uniref:DUF4230 domain-containing protein n=1 Tax=Nocardiopsis composta TaxID=157465 RepID=A0A7W8VCL7_9ACTN|nr:hypothetical protein [Nocardiopsis composta]MBB5431063.1 hypothetical protein [Nocardiopsis composta]